MCIQLSTIVVNGMAQNGMAQNSTGNLPSFFLTMTMALIFSVGGRDITNNQ